jgi:hypothetical protein
MTLPFWAWAILYGGGSVAALFAGYFYVIKPIMNYGADKERDDHEREKLDRAEANLETATHQNKIANRPDASVDTLLDGMQNNEQ